MRKIEKIDDILESITEIVFPFVVIFGIYVVLNGHLSPGGGFSGGAILSAGLILYDVVFNQDNAPIILIVEDESAIAESLSFALRRDGFAVQIE